MPAISVIQKMEAVADAPHPEAENLAQAYEMWVRTEATIKEIEGKVDAAKDLVKDIIGNRMGRQKVEKGEIPGHPDAKITIAARHTDKWIQSGIRGLLQKLDKDSKNKLNLEKQVFRNRIVVDLEDPEIASLIIEFLKKKKKADSSLNATLEEFCDEGRFQHLIDRGFIDSGLLKNDKHYDTRTTRYPLKYGKPNLGGE